MKFLTILKAGLIAIALYSHRVWAYDDYDKFYASLPGTLFIGPIPRNDENAGYSIPGIPGSFLEWDFELEGKRLNIEVCDNRIVVNGRKYLFSHARSLEKGNREITPGDDTRLFLSRRAARQPSVLCVEGIMDSDADWYKQKMVYLLINPFSTRQRATFLHLRGAFSSCRAILKTEDGEIIYPDNHYLFKTYDLSPGVTYGLRSGLLIKYYTFDGGKFIPANKEIRLHFTVLDDPDQFSVQSEDGSS